MQQIRPGEYGALQFITIVQSVLTVVLPLGLGNALLRSYFDYSEAERPRVTTTALIFLVGLCLAVLLPLYRFAPQCSQLILHDNRFDAHFRLVFIATFFQVIKLVPDSVLRSKMDSVRYMVVTFTALLVQLTAVLFFILARDESVYGILKGTLLGAAFETTALFALMYRDLTFGFDFKELRRMLAFGSPLIFGRLSSLALQSIDRFFIQHYAPTYQDGKREVGFYAMANNVSNAVSFLVTTPFGQVWPSMQVSRMKDHDALEYYARILTYVVLCASFLALGASCVTLDIFRLFGRYVESATVVPLLCVAAVLDAASQVLSVGVSLKRKTYINPLIYGTAAAVNIGLNFLLIPKHGMLGATWATVIGFLVLCGLRYAGSQMFLPVPYEWRRLGQLAALSIALHWLARFVSTSSTWLDLVLHTLIATSLPLWLYLTGFLDERERKKLGEFWQRGIRYIKRIEDNTQD
ncbi:MAG: oligosaccharide flippase family protein [Blastocatellia bacterium]|nr:oligosaccharide flippase family protein [Blastocatellia bacterium]